MTAFTQCGAKTDDTPVEAMSVSMYAFSVTGTDNRQAGQVS